MKIYVKLLFLIIFMLSIVISSSYASPDNGKILYTKNRALYIVPFTSSSITGESKMICALKYSLEFTTDCLWSKFSLSPDGKKIIFIEKKDIMDASSWSRLCIMNSDGSDFQELTSKSVNNINFQWFSDSKRILYSEETIDARGNYHSGNIYMMDLKTGKIKTLIQKGIYPLLSSDEKDVLYIFERTDYTEKKDITTKLYCVDIYGKNNRCISKIPGWKLTNDWSKDKSMALSGEFVVNIKTGKNFRYAEKYSASKGWFLDNKQIIYITMATYNSGLNPNIIITDINGSIQKQLTQSGDVDGILAITEKKIYYTRTLPDYGKAIWSINRDGSEPERLLKTEEKYPEINIWFPGNN